MADDIRALTARLAADPASLVFLELGEALRQRGQLDAAYKVARTGLARYPDLARAHDLCARILCDRREPDRAFEEWVTALELDPGLAAAHKGLGFLYYQAGDLASAERHLALAASGDPADSGTQAALERVRARQPMADAAPTPAGDGGSRPGPGTAAEPAPALAQAPPADPAPELDRREPGGIEASVIAELEQGSGGLLLVNPNGLRLGGRLEGEDGADVSDPVAALLAGVSREAARTARLLALGEWTHLAVECPDAHLVLAAMKDGGVLLVLRGSDAPMGRLARFAERAALVAARWLEGAP